MVETLRQPSAAGHATRSRGHRLRHPQRRARRIRRSSRTSPTTGASTSRRPRFKGPVDTPTRRTRRPRRPARQRAADGGPAGSSLDLLREQVLDPWNVEIGILNCAYAVDSIHNPDAAAGDGQRRQRLADRRVAGQGAAPARLDRRAGPAAGDGGAGDRPRRRPSRLRPGLPAGPLRGSRTATAATTRSSRPSPRHDLVVGLHFGGAPGNPPTAVRLAVVLPRGVRRRWPRSSSPSSSA